MAEWCGACQAWKPELEKIVKENNIVVPIAKVDESNMEMYNSVRRENGLSPITVEKYPTIMKEEGTSGPQEIEREEVVSIATNNGKPMNMEIGEAMSMKTGDPQSPIVSSPIVSSPIVSPPSLQADEIKSTTSTTSNSTLSKTTVGGCYQAMASTAYHLAPAGILLAAAAATLKRKGKKGQKRRLTRRRR